MQRHLLLVFFTLALVGCATHYTPDAIADPYGFFSGLWHGAIAGLTIAVNIFSWIVSLIGIDILKNVQIIGRPNTGFSYYAGFAVGMCWLKLL